MSVNVSTPAVARTLDTLYKRPETLSEPTADHKAIETFSVAVGIKDLHDFTQAAHRSSACWGMGAIHSVRLGRVQNSHVRLLA